MSVTTKIELNGCDAVYVMSSRVLHWIVDTGSNQKTIFRFSLKPDGKLTERYTGALATALAKDVFSLGQSLDCLVAVNIQRYSSMSNGLYDQPFVRELAEVQDFNVLCESRARFLVGADYISRNGSCRSIKVNVALSWISPPLQIPTP